MSTLMMPKIFLSDPSIVREAEDPAILLEFVGELGCHHLADERIRSTVSSQIGVETRLLVPRMKGARRGGLCQQYRPLP
jgi:hypothetical protein